MNTSPIQKISIFYFEVLFLLFSSIQCQNGIDGPQVVNDEEFQRRRNSYIQIKTTICLPSDALQTIQEKRIF